MIYRHLSSNSQGTFLWVALVFQYPNKALWRRALGKPEAFPPDLNSLCGRIIDQSAIRMMPNSASTYPLSCQ